jgi:hypothetical protein
METVAWQADASAASSTVAVPRPVPLTDPDAHETVIETSTCAPTVTVREPWACTAVVTEVNPPSK